MSATKGDDYPVTKEDFPAVCEGCEKLLFNVQMWRGHQAVDYCDAVNVIPGLPGGAQP